MQDDTVLAQEPATAAPAGRPAWLAIALFLGAFLVMQLSWQGARGSAVERLWIEEVTVKPAAALINLITPQAGAVAEGARIRAPRGGINVLNGCEGTDVLFMLCAALLACPLTWRARLQGFALGVLLVFGLNQTRVVGLFFAAREDRALFDLLHGTVAPILLVATVALFFHAFLHRQRALAGTA